MVLLAITTCFFILLHTTWMILAFEGFRNPKGKYYYIIWVVLSHLGASYAVSNFYKYYRYYQCPF
jgi:anterior pharynx defective protein 1